jgi:hypothetical protein
VYVVSIIQHDRALAGRGPSDKVFGGNPDLVGTAASRSLGLERTERRKMTDSKEDMIVAKAINEAESGLKGLQKELESAMKKFADGSLTDAKSKAIAAKIMAFMKKQKAILKIQHSDLFARLTQENQDEIDWLDGVVNDLNNALGKLDGVLKLAKKDPSKPKEYTILVKTSRELSTRTSQPPKGVGTLLKEAKKGLNPDHPQFGMISLLPAALLFWLIVDTIVRGLNAKGKKR